jgi:alpha-tubulin suppressor-like RCC1 family protein
MHTCSLLVGVLRCWGSNYWGAVGDGTNGTNRLVPTEVAGLPAADAVASVACGNWHTCALLASGEVWCWGGNQQGALGDGTATNRLVPTRVTGLLPAVALVAGGLHTCALLSSGDAACWGWNANGQLGDGTTVNRLVPTNVTGLLSSPPAGRAVIESLTAGLFHTCALFSSGDAQCWGRNDDGQLGDGTNTSRNVPTLVAGLPSASVALAAGGYHTCALLSSGDAACWGMHWLDAGRFGQLGDGTNISRASPSAVIGLP